MCFSMSSNHGVHVYFDCGFLFIKVFFITKRPVCQWFGEIISFSNIKIRMHIMIARHGKRTTLTEIK